MPWFGLWTDALYVLPRNRLAPERKQCGEEQVLLFHRARIRVHAFNQDLDSVAPILQFLKGAEDADFEHQAEQDDVLLDSWRPNGCGQPRAEGVRCRIRHTGELLRLPSTRTSPCG